MLLYPMQKREKLSKMTSLPIWHVFFRDRSILHPLALVFVKFTHSKYKTGPKLSIPDNLYPRAIFGLFCHRWTPMSV